MSAFSTLLTQIIPLGLGAAVSPTALMVLILLLSISKRPKVQGLGYYIGAVIMVSIVAVLGIILGVGVTSASNKSDPILAVIDIVLGILLLVLGFREIFKPQKPIINNFLGDSKKTSTITQFIKGLSFGFGMFLINFSTTIIILEAGKQIGSSSADIYGKLIVLIVLILITLLVCELPLIIYFLFPKKANNILSHVNKWMQKNGHYLMGIVLVIIGLYLMWIGFLRLGII